ncbi:lasso peptide biosynthesis B2 protein [Pseudonocardia sp. ICBG1142]|uniref:lasso peptide biosynthesis B2 protein n=1 Tax=Pseudonocardia sp. ICBG1142 TaxID=2846760 RepID=UPI001CF65913
MRTNQAIPSSGQKFPVHVSLLARMCIAMAYLLSRLKPEYIARFLHLMRKGARPASYPEAAAARASVISNSIYCAGEGCLPRSLATVLVCRAKGSWPTWVVGARLEPFLAHAWVEAEGIPVEENFASGFYAALLTVT